jgi:uncharacterized protein YlxW (UPF0749 family)
MMSESEQPTQPIATSRPAPSPGPRRGVRQLATTLLQPPRWRLTRAHLLAGLLLGLLGFSLVVQAHQTKAGNLTTLSQSDLVRLLDDVNRRSDRLDVEARDLQRTSEDLRTGSDKAAAAEKAARKRLEVLGILAGTLPAEGPGITLTVNDPSGAVDAAMMLDTVQELRDAGAEAIQIGAVRVVASTSFIDDTSDAGGVAVDGVRLNAPYTFTAIGDAATLDSALDIPGGVLETLRQSEASGTVRRGVDLTVSAVRPVTRPEYAVPNAGS